MHPVRLLLRTLPDLQVHRWEIDSPRGKLVLLYGMLSGELEPSDYIANKIFECFHCNRCQKACSSGVPIQDVYNDARAFFLESGFDVVGTTSQTDHDVCARCLNCVRMCKHEARSFVDGKIVTDRLKCQSCGSCLDICPEKGVYHPHRLRHQSKRAHRSGPVLFHRSGQSRCQSGRVHLRLFELSRSSVLPL